jgi:hypothetical protein
VDRVGVVDDGRDAESWAQHSVTVHVWLQALMMNRAGDFGRYGEDEIASSE